MIDFILSLVGGGTSIWAYVVAGAGALVAVFGTLWRVKRRGAKEQQAKQERADNAHGAEIRDRLSRDRAQRVRNAEGLDDSGWRD